MASAPPSPELHGAASYAIRDGRVHVQVIRALMFVLAWPFLRNMGYSIRVKDCIVLSW